MYETAIANAEKAGDGGKARRYKRGLKVHTGHLKTGTCTIHAGQTAFNVKLGSIQ